MWTLNWNSTWATTDDVSQVHKNTSTDKNAYWETASGFQTSQWSTPSTGHFVCLPISDTPTSGLAVSTNELMSWIRCDRWGRHTKCAGVGYSRTGLRTTDLKHTAKATQECLKVNQKKSGLFCNGQVSLLISTRLSMHFTCWRQD